MNNRFKGSMRLFRNARTMLTTRRMASAWVRWHVLRTQGVPSLTTPTGSKISGFRDFSEYWSATAMMPTPGELAYFDRYADESGVVLDIGANLGCVSLPLAQMRPKTHVLSFEPSPQTNARLALNVAANNITNIEVRPEAVGAFNGTAEFLDDSSSPATNRLLSYSRADRGTVGTPVKIVTIDTILEDQPEGSACFCKIDVEGHETDVIKGAERSLSEMRCRAGLIELCPANLYQAGSSVKDLVLAVQACGWELFNIDTDGRVKSRIKADGEGVARLANVALLPSKRDRGR